MKITISLGSVSVKLGNITHSCTTELVELRRLKGLRRKIHEAKLKIPILYITYCIGPEIGTMPRWGHKNDICTCNRISVQNDFVYNDIRS